MSISCEAWAGIFCLTAVDVIGTSAITFWSKHDDEGALFVGLLMFTLLGLFMAWTIRECGHMNVVSCLWQTSSILVVALVSRFLFFESMENRHIAGVFLAMVASLCFV